MQVDNSAALVAIRNQGIVIQPVRISLEENNLADLASHYKVIPDWSLNQLVVDKIFHGFEQIAT